MRCLVFQAESESSPVVADIKKEDGNIVAKRRQAKGKRKSSVTSVKDMKPISNIKSLVKRPTWVLSEVHRRYYNLCNIYIL